jgi:hypothetical protein
MTGATASRAVLFSGSTFVVALLGMFLVPVTILRSLAAGAVIVGVVSAAVALTLLPAMLNLIGDRVNSLRLPNRATWPSSGTSRARARTRSRSSRQEGPAGPGQTSPSSKPRSPTTRASGPVSFRPRQGCQGGEADRGGHDRRNHQRAAGSTQELTLPQQPKADFVRRF